MTFVHRNVFRHRNIGKRSSRVQRNLFNEALYGWIHYISARRDCFTEQEDRIVSTYLWLLLWLQIFGV